MACCINISNNSISADGGGKWKLKNVSGGGAAPITTYAGSGCNGTSKTTNVNEFTTNPASDSFSVNGNDLTAGVYVFEYILLEGQACEVTTEFTVNVQDAPEAGESDSGGAYCVGYNDPIDIWECLDCDNLNCYVVPAPGQPWTFTFNGGSTSAPTGFVWTPATPSAVWTPAVNAAAGTYTFTYTVTAPGTDPSCSNCTDSATCTVTLQAAPNAGTPSSTSVCNTGE